MPERVAAQREIAAQLAAFKISVEQVPLSILELAKSIDRDAAKRQRQITWLKIAVTVLSLAVLGLLAVAITNRQTLHEVQKTTGVEARTRSAENIERIKADIRQASNEDLQNGLNQALEQSAQQVEAALNQALVDIAQLQGKPPPPPVTIPRTTTTATTATTQHP